MVEPPPKVSKMQVDVDTGSSVFTAAQSGRLVDLIKENWDKINNEDKKVVYHIVGVFGFRTGGRVKPRPVEPVGKEMGEIQKNGRKLGGLYGRFFAIFRLKTLYKV